MRWRLLRKQMAQAAAEFGAARGIQAVFHGAHTLIREVTGTIVDRVPVFMQTILKFLQQMQDSVPGRRRRHQQLPGDQTDGTADADGGEACGQRVAADQALDLTEGGMKSALVYRGFLIGGWNGGGIVHGRII